MPFGLGALAALGFGGTTYQALVMWLGISITAIAVQSIILHSLSINKTAIGHIIIGAAIADDILALVTLSVILGVAKTGTVQFAEVAVIGLKVVAFFASLSFHLHFEWTWDFLLYATVITLVASAGKVGGCGLGLYLFRRNFWEAAVVGFGMNGRGAVELVIASVFLKVSEELEASGRIVEPLITENQFSALILMAFITTLIAPISLRWAAAKACSSEGKALPIDSTSCFR